MAGEIPAYDAQQDVGPAPRVGSAIMAVPNYPNEVAPAAAQLGEAGQEFADKMLHATQAANATNALSTYLVSLDKEKTARLQDPNWQQSPQLFSKNVGDLQNDALSAYNFDPRTAATLRLHMTHATIVAGDEVNKTSLIKGTQQWENDYQTQADFNQAAAVTAGSPTVRQTSIDRNDALIKTGLDAGWISAARAAEMQRNFHVGLDHADALHAIAADPRAAIATLSDPNAMPTLTAPQREAYIENARDKIDTDATERARGTVAGKPYVASLIAGQFVDPAHVGSLFDQGVVPAESGGKNAPPNDKGAFGPAQITPAFARNYVSRLPAEEQAALGDLSKLSDADLTAKLQALPKISTDIGRTGFQALAQKYNGDPVLAMAAYNAGPANADRWQAAAQKQFGPNPTPNQTLSVIDFPETQKYVAGIYAKANAPTDAFGVSSAGRYHLGIAVGTELQQQATRDQHVLDQVAAVQSSQDPIPKLLNDGVDVGASRIADYRTAQLQAAQGGDVEAARRLHELDLAIAVKPQVDRLYRLPFPAVDALVNAADAQMKAPGANASDDDVRTLDVLKKTRDAIASARTNDPTSLIVRAGLGKQVALDTAADASDPDFRAGLTARGSQAVMAQKIYGGTAMALTPDEQQSMKERFAGAPPPEQFKIVKALADTLPEASYNDTVKAVTGNSPGADIIGRFARTQPELAEQMLQGAQLMKNKSVEALDGKNVDTAIGDTLKGQLWPSPAQQGAVIQAALYLDAARRAQDGGRNKSASSGLPQAIEDITGALTSRNGLQVAAPPGMRAGQFTALLDGLNDRDVAASGGAVDRNGNAVPAADIARNGVLKQQSPGSPLYWVGVKDPAARDGFQPYFTSSELPSPLTFDMRRIAALGAAKNRVTEGDTAGQREAATRAEFAGQ